jgi:hypothetical protein
LEEIDKLAAVDALKARRAILQELKRRIDGGGKPIPRPKRAAHWWIGVSRVLTYDPEDVAHQRLLQRALIRMSLEATLTITERVAPGWGWSIEREPDCEDAPLYWAELVPPAAENSVGVASGSLSYRSTAFALLSALVDLQLRRLERVDEAGSRID